MGIKKETDKGTKMNMTSIKVATNFSKASI